MSDTAPNKAGRKPFEITQEVIGKAESLAQRGLTLEQIASCLGICERTLYDKKAEYSDFAAAIKRGQAKGVQFVANKLFEKVESGDTTSTIFYLKCRAGWSETQTQNHQGSVGITLGYYEPPVPPS